MEISQAEKILEALLFASGEPIRSERISQVMQVERETVDKLAIRLRDTLEERDSALTVLKLGDSYQIAAKKDYSSYIKQMLDTRRNAPLSQAALEVLSIVAYNQPVTKGFIEQVRGVDSSAVVAGLVQKGLVEERGRLEVPGRPVLFGTTSDFLRCFNISGLDELPPLPKQEEPEEEAQ